MNEDWRQTEIADEVSTAARQLAHSTRTVPSPPDSYRLLGELGMATTSLAQVVQQLARWHDNVEEGVDHFGEDERGDGRGTATAGYELSQAHAALVLAAEHIALAHSANGVVRWCADGELIVASPERLTFEDYAGTHGIHQDVATPGFGLFGEQLHSFPKYSNGQRTDYLEVMLHGPMGGPGNLVVTDTTTLEVWLYREQVMRDEAIRTINEGIAHAKRLGRDFEHTDMDADF